MTTGIIGINNLPNQYHKIISRKWVHYTLLLVGSSGLGKTTFINTLFNTELKVSNPGSHNPLSGNDNPAKTQAIDVLRVGTEFLFENFYL
jgi:cell division control protein 12